MRNISFALTTPQYRAGTKTVTRRFGWESITPDTHLMGCVKCQGIRPGETIQRIHPCIVVSNQPEPLRRLIEDPAYGRVECILEGFPGMEGHEFVEMFARHMKVQNPYTSIVNRIQFTHLFPHDWIYQSLDRHTTTAPETNTELHHQIAVAFTRAGIPFGYKVKLLDGHIDFRVLGHVAVQVNPNAIQEAVTLENLRFLEDPTLDQAIIITTQPMELLISEYTTQTGIPKPIHFIRI